MLPTMTMAQKKTVVGRNHPTISASKDSLLDKTQQCTCAHLHLQLFEPKAGAADYRDQDVRCGKHSATEGAPPRYERAEQE